MVHARHLHHNINCPTSNRQMELRICWVYDILCNIPVMRRSYIEPVWSRMQQTSITYAHMNSNRPVELASNSPQYFDAPFLN